MHGALTALSQRVFRVVLKQNTWGSPWNRVRPGKITGSQLAEDFSAFYGARRFITAFTTSLPCPYSEPDQSTQRLPYHFLKICFIVTLPSTPGSSKLSLSLLSFRPLGWYWITDLSSHYVVFLISRSNQFFWCAFKYLFCYWFSVWFQCWEFIWPSGTVSRNSGIQGVTGGTDQTSGGCSLC